MLTKIFNSKYLILIILVFAALTRFYQLNYPAGYVFDEVYHSFTAKEYLAGHKEAWEYWTTPPSGVAYEWTHPPLAKEITAVSMWITQTTESWAYRLPGVILGIISIYLVYILGKSLFKSENVGLLSAFIFSLDGLSFVQSRTGMNDIYFLTFALASLVFFIRKNLFLSSVFLGLALSSKWTAMYLFLVYMLLLFGIRFSVILFKMLLLLITGRVVLIFTSLMQVISLIKINKVIYLAYFILIPPLIYLLTYTPFLLQDHTFTQFKELQRQMWWYHTGLKATHDYASPWWSWPLNLYPVWYFVDYLKDGRIVNIFASGNQILLWLGVVGVLATFWETVKVFIVRAKQELLTKVEPQIIVLLCFFAFWLPWAISPRIMFLYHYLPSIPFLCLALGYQLNKQLEQKNKKLVIWTLVLILLVFVITFPVLSGIPMSKDYIEFFFKTNITKNPFN